MIIFRNSNTNTNIYKILTYLIVMELILCGSGRVITFGDISLRYVFMLIGLLYGFIQLIKEPLDSSYKIYIILILYIIFEIFYGIMNGNRQTAIIVGLGYLCLLLIPFFNKYLINEDRAFRLFEYIEKLTIILALFSIIIWLYCLIYGQKSFYDLQPLFDKYVFGGITVSKNTLPKLFLKGSVFVSLCFTYEIQKLINNIGNKRGTIIKLVILGVSIITTFTLGLWMIIPIGIVLLILSKKETVNLWKKETVALWKKIKLNSWKKNALISVLIGIVIIILYQNLHITKVITSKFEYGGSIIYKMLQVKYLFLYYLDKPILGYGFGQQFEILYLTKKTVLYDVTYKFEVMWMQWLTNTGLIGFLLYSSYILVIVKKLKTKIKNYDKYKFLYATCFINAIFLILLSFINPFMNNTLGLFYFDIIVGVALISTQKKGIESKNMSNCLVGIIVIYNSLISDNKTIEKLKNKYKKSVNTVIIDNSTNEETIQLNQKFCNDNEIPYINMEGNKGLSKAYNAGLIYARKNFTEFWYMLLDQDTYFSDEYFNNVILNIKETPEIPIKSGIVHDKNHLMSPRYTNFFLCRIMKNFKANKIYKNIDCINSGLVIDDSIMDGKLYDEDFFIDMIDYNFMYQLRTNGYNQIQLINGNIEQSYSGFNNSTYENDLKRYKLFCNDIHNYRMKTGKSIIYEKFIILKRRIKLSINYRRLIP